jgi:hypothetical protein
MNKSSGRTTTKKARVVAYPDRSTFDDDERIALLLSGDVGSAGFGGLTGALRGDPDGEKFHVMIDEVCRGECPPPFREMWEDLAAVHALTPLANAAINSLGISVTKAQARGHYSRKAHEWIDQIMAYDTGLFPEQTLHTPLAVAAGISVDAIEAYRDGRLDDLPEDDRQHVDFIKAFLEGRITDDLWDRQVELVGSERGVIEQMLMTANLHQHFRKRQAFGAPDWPEERLNDLLDALRAGQHTLPNITAYERAYDEAPWPRLSKAFLGES